MNPGELGKILSRSTLRLLVLVFAVMILLFVLTGFLVRDYRREMRVRAERQYKAGQELAQKGDFEGAIDQYAEALTLSRDNPIYRQALALALMKTGRTKEAEAYLRELIRTDPANGVANLMLARIYAGRGDLEAATGYYQRAIYGLWPDNPDQHRLSTRFELIELLEKEGKTTQMEAELLRLVGEAPDDPAVKKRIGRLFLAAGSPQNAKKMFEEVVRKNRKDAEAWAGLGDAEFGLKHYLSASSAYRWALRYRPNDLQSRSQLELARGVINLDPTRRGLGSATRLRISRQLVARALSAQEYCLPEDLEVLPEDFRAAVEKARDLVSGKTRQKRTSEAVDQNIGLAERLEHFRKQHCGAAPVEDVALQLVLEKLAD